MARPNNDDLGKMLRELLDLEEGLSSKTIELLDSLARQSDKGTKCNRLSDRQAEVIVSIWNDKLG